MWHDRASVGLQTAAADQRRATTTVAKEERRGAGRSWGVSKSPTIRGRRIALSWAAMTKEFPITAGDHGTGVAQECLDGMTGRGRLPFVPVKPAGVQKNPRDLLLRDAGPMAIEGP